MKVPVYRQEKTVKGRHYTYYLVPDYSEGARRVRTFSDPEAAKAKAAEIAEMTIKGRTEILTLDDDIRIELRKAMQAVQSVGVSILPAAQLFCEAVKILGSPDQMLAAAQHWVRHRPDKPITPKTCREACEHYKERAQQRGLSERRQRNLGYVLDNFVSKFGDKGLHEVEAVELGDYAQDRNWSPKTFNDFIATVSLIYKEAQFRGWVPKDFNPAKSVKRRKQTGGAIGIFEPWEVRQLLSRLDPSLVPFFALWCFSGCRKEEASRLSWQQVNRGLETGSIYLEADQTKTRHARSVPIADNLRLWLMKHRKTSGDVLPKKWQGFKQLSQITKRASRKTGVVWKDNGPRHSFGTYHFKLHKDAGATVSAMGNSLLKFQRHYWNRSESVTAEVAKEYFSIVPEVTAETLPLPQASGQ